MTKRIDPEVKFFVAAYLTETAAWLVTLGIALANSDWAVAAVGTLIYLVAAMGSVVVAAIILTVRQRRAAPPE